MTTPEHYLKHHFGYDQFRYPQAEIISHIMDSQHALGDHAHRQRQVAVLSDSGPDAGRKPRSETKTADIGSLAADCVDEGSGGFAAVGRNRGKVLN